ncbi:MAG: hypothetical protein ACRDNZ_00950, partial [Streptosporangiaceae bacterium]
DMPLIAAKRHGPRNVFIRRGDGSVTCRPFRGLRVPPPAADAQSGPLTATSAGTARRLADGER